MENKPVNQNDFETDGRETRNDDETQQWFTFPISNVKLNIDVVPRNKKEPKIKIKTRQVTKVQTWRACQTDCLRVILVLASDRCFDERDFTNLMVC